VQIYPLFDEEYFEWINLLEAVISASRRFSLFLVAVEGEPTHFEWLIENSHDNEVRPEDCGLIHAAVSAEEERSVLRLATRRILTLRQSAEVRKWTQSVSQL